MGRITSYRKKNVLGMGPGGLVAAAAGPIAAGGASGGKVLLIVALNSGLQGGIRTLQALQPSVARAVARAGREGGCRRLGRHRRCP